MSDNLTFENLIGNVEHVHDITSAYAKGAVNQLLTVRNWMIGYYIVEYEQHGQNRAEYGTNLLGEMANSLNITGPRVLYQVSSDLCDSVAQIERYRRIKVFAGFVTGRE